MTDRQLRPIQPIGKLRKVLLSVHLNTQVDAHKFIHSLGAAHVFARRSLTPLPIEELTAETLQTAQALFRNLLTEGLDRCVRLCGEMSIMFGESIEKWDGNGSSDLGQSRLRVHRRSRTQ